MDFSHYPLSGKMYGGSEKKIGILIDNERYIVKFQKDSMTGYSIIQIIDLTTQLHQCKI